MSHKACPGSCHISHVCGQHAHCNGALKVNATDKVAELEGVWFAGCIQLGKERHRPYPHDAVCDFNNNSNLWVHVGETFMVCFTGEETTLESECSFISLFIHVCFRFMRLYGAALFQVSFNESQVYLGHSTGTVSFYQGTSPSVSSEWAAACLCPVSTVFPPVQRPASPVHHTLFFIPYGALSLWSESPGYASQTSSKNRQSLCHAACSVVMPTKAYSAEHIPFRECSFRMVRNKCTWDCYSSWRAHNT